MSVYVDPAAHRFGRMTMCHMMADTSDELLAMADRIGVAQRWLQHPGEWREHFDVCKSKRALAVAAGAVEVSSRTLVLAARARAEDRKQLATDSPQPAPPVVPVHPNPAATGGAAHVESGAPPARAEDGG